MAKKKPAAKAAAKEPTKPNRKRVVEKEAIFEAPVKFGNVNIGKRTGRVGIAIPRPFCTLGRADELFVDRRLSAKIILGGAGDAPGQTTFVEPDVTINAEFDVKGFRVGADVLSGLGLTFVLKEVDLDQVSQLSGGSGRIVVKAVNRIPADAVDEDFEELPGQKTLPVATGPWADVPLHEAMPQMPKGLRAKMKEAGLHTMGDLQTFVAKHGDFWAAQIKGVGASTRAKLEDWQADFWARNPQYSKT